VILCPALVYTRKKRTKSKNVTKDLHIYNLLSGSRISLSFFGHSFCCGEKVLLGKSHEECTIMQDESKMKWSNKKQPYADRD
jgi:hypothetical protein